MSWCNPTVDPISQFEKKMIDHYYYLYQDMFVTKRDEMMNSLRAFGSSYIDALILGKRYALQEVSKYDDDIQAEKGVWKCPICDHRIKDMGAHVIKAHQLTWEYFVSKYNWQGSKIFFDDHHKQSLSENKVRFYKDTDRGQQLKKLASVKYSGQNNPACADEVRKKISASRLGKSYVTDEYKEELSKRMYGGFYSNKYNSWGYKFFTIHNGKEIMLRSKAEYTIFVMLKHYKFDFEYEPFKIEYRDPSVKYLRHYLPDFIVGDRMIEVKSCKEDAMEGKYLYINETLKTLGKRLEFVFPNTFYSVFNIPDDLQLPLVDFNTEIFENISNGYCKLVLPKACYGINRSDSTTWIQTLGLDQDKVISEGASKYEDFKSKNI